jgi:LuxR family transcriptional regulator, maltose regulon positive regulatory protein
MAQFIERLPEHVRLAVATRFDPPLPIPRLRVRDQLSEIRASDLRFTGAEISELFQRMPGIEIIDQDIDTIHASTEGWAAGLKMAALALQMQPRSGQEARRFWESFTGRNTYILDYLTEEVLAGLPEETQTFLMKTSVLDRLTGGLCAKVVFDQDDQADAARVLLEDLERRNMFLIPLDQERRWFRYHHLFADLLRVRLQQRHGDEISSLHERAAIWYERAGLIEAAMRHAVAAGDWQRAARLVEEHAQEYLDRGQLAVVLRWIEALPGDMLRSRPNLCIQMTWTMGHAGRTHLIGPMLQAAEAALNIWERQQEEPTLDTLVNFTDQDAVRVKASLAFHRAYRLVITEQPEQALRLAENALETLPNLETRERAWLTWVKRLCTARLRESRWGCAKLCPSSCDCSCRRS